MSEAQEIVDVITKKGAGKGAGKNASIVACIIAVLPFVSACNSDSHKDASNKNFKATLNGYLEKNCEFIGLFKGSPATMTLPRKGDISLGGRHPTISYDALASLGLLDTEETTAEVETSIFDKTLVAVPARTYTLSEKGKSALTEQKRRNGDVSEGFCAVTFEVSEIVNFTEPNSEIGFTLSEVYYTVSPKNIPDWANADELEATWPSIAEKMVENREENDVLILTNNGWVHEMDMPR